MKQGLQPTAPSDPLGAPKLCRWSVWRQDDSGNRFLIEVNLTEAEAKSTVPDLEAREHKQVYWSAEEI